MSFKNPGRLPTNLPFSLCSPRSNPLGSPLALQQNTRAAFQVTLSLPLIAYRSSLLTVLPILLLFLSLQLQKALLPTHKPCLPGNQIDCPQNGSLAVSPVSIPSQPQPCGRAPWQPSLFPPPVDSTNLSLMPSSPNLLLSPRSQLKQAPLLTQVSLLSEQ